MVSQGYNRFGGLAGYQIGYGSISIILSIPPAVYLMLGYTSNLNLAIASIVILVASIAAVYGRGFVDRWFTHYRTYLQPRVTNVYSQLLVMAGVYAIIKFSAGLIINNAQIASISSFGQGNDLAILAQTSIMETLLIQYFVFVVFFAAAAAVTRSYTSGLLIGTGLGSLWAYIIHQYVYNSTPSVWNWVLFSFIVLNLGYGLTGNILVALIPHLLIDTLPLIIMLLFPGACPAAQLWGVC